MMTSVCARGGQTLDTGPGECEGSPKHTEKEYIPAFYFLGASLLSVSSSSSPQLSLIFLQTSSVGEKTSREKSGTGLTGMCVEAGGSVNCFKVSD